MVTDIGSDIAEDRSGPEPLCDYCKFVWLVEQPLGMKSLNDVLVVCYGEIDWLSADVGAKTTSAAGDTKTPEACWISIAEGVSGMFRTMFST